MNQPKYYSTDYFLNRGGIESIYGVTAKLNPCCDGCSWLKAYFLGNFHGKNEDRRHNPYDKDLWENENQAYEKGFFVAWKDRMEKEGRDWVQEIGNV